MDDTIIDIDQSEEDILARYEVSDEALEAAAAGATKMAILTGDVRAPTAGFCGC
jgi:hypothetical protein